MTARARVRAGELLCNTSLAFTTAIRHLVDDPLHLVLQSSRRLPYGARARLGRALQAAGRSEGSVRRAAGYWLADLPDDARAALARVRATAPGSLRSRLRGELAVQLACTDTVPGLVLDALPAVRARASWQRGDLSEAVSTAGGARSTRALHARLASEVRVMTPGVAIGPARSPVAVPVASSGALGVLHVLTSSLPHTQSGYALRSHSVLRAQRGAGLRVAGCTRLGYPVSIGRLDARHTDVVDGVVYHRLITPVADRTAEERVHQGVARLLPVVDALGADVLHATTNFMNALVSRSVAARLGIPWVYEVRGLLEQSWVASRPPGAQQDHAWASEKHSVLRARETEMASEADHVFTLSETLRAELVGRGIPDEKISIVPNAVDDALLTADLSPTAARRRLGMPEHGFWVGTVSSLVGYEGLDTLLDAIALLRRRGLDVRGLVVGDGVSRPGLEAHARTLGIASAVTFTGRVDRSQAALHHQALDVFVVPRRDVQVCRTVTPLKPVEAMACARPVIASDLPALAELVQDEVGGLLVPPGNAAALSTAVERLLDEPLLRATLGGGARAAVRNRTWSAVGAVYAETYARLGASRMALR